MPTCRQNQSSSLVDLHVNGLTLPSQPGLKPEVVNFSSAELTLEQVRLATESLVQAGTARFLATLVTGAPETTIRNVRLLASAMHEPWGEPIMGVHLEGPFFSLECKGAHPEQYIREQTDIELFREFFSAAQGKVVLTTVSPATRDATSFIRQVTDMGVLVSIGHHNANVEQIEMAFKAGATGVTHAGNAWSRQRPEDDRKNMEVAAQLCEEKAFVMVIPDGVHVSPTFVKYAYKIVEAVKPGRIVWVSDCSPFAGAPTGSYEGFAGEPVSVARDKAGALRTYPLTGSYLLLSECLDVLRKMDVVPERDILAGATSNPLDFVEPALKRINRFPSLAPLVQLGSEMKAPSSRSEPAKPLLG